MTSFSRLAIKKMDVLRIIERRQGNPTPYFPSDKSLINAVIPRSSVIEDEDRSEQITCSDYDDWVEQALFDLLRKPIPC